MREHNGISHKEAVERLKQFGITNEKIYLINLILLVEMMWADGQAQKGEREILEKYLEKHIDNVNKRAGCEVLQVQDARDFVKPHLDKRPDPETIKSLRELVKPISFSVPSNMNEKLKDELLHVCMDMGAISTTKYPFPHDERFNKEEKQCFFKILQALS